MKHLHKWGLKDTPNCNCGEIETIAHAVYECEKAKDTISNFKEILTEYGINAPIFQSRSYIRTTKGCKKPFYTSN
jgi:hypothetical protein